jgi:hypothetical protein
MSFRQTVRPLLLAPLGAIALVSGRVLVNRTFIPYIWIYWFFTALTCYVVEALFVVPFLLWQPRLRQPAIWVGGAWGILVSWCLVVVLASLPPPPSGDHFWFGWGSVADFSCCGLLSGVVYSMASRAGSRPISN